MRPAPAARHSHTLLPWLFALLLIPSQASSSRRDPQSLLVPAPAHIHALSGSTALDSSWSIVLADSSADLPGANLLARDVLRIHGWTWPILTTRSPGPAIVLTHQHLASPEPHAEQGYTLSIAPRLIRITAPTPQGRFYALQTLRQLVRLATQPNLPCLFITDSPSLPWRGVSDDISRGQISTLADFRQRFEELAYYKINLVLLYLEDVYTNDLGSTDALAREELALLARAAGRYHIRLVPILQTFGYTPSIARALSSDPNGPLGLPAHGHDRSRILPFTDRALATVLRKVDTIASACPGAWFHIGGDELGTFGLGVPAGDKISKDGKTHLAYASLLSRRLETPHRRSMLVYGDFVHRFPLVRDSLARSTIIVDWNYYPDGDFGGARRLHDAGFDSVFVSPGLWNWSTFYPNYGRAFRNVAAFIDSGREAAMGTVTSAWGDNGAECLRSYTSLGYAFGAAASWEAASPGETSFLRRYTAAQFGVESLELAEAQRLIGWRELKGIDYAGRVFHRLPRVRSMGKEWKGQMVELCRDMMKAREYIHHAQKAARFNALQLDELMHAVRRWHYFATRELAMAEIARALEKAPGPKSQANAAAQLSSLRNELSAIAREFARLWLVRNKLSGLEANMRRLHRQLNELSALEAAAERGELRVWRPGDRPLTPDPRFSVEGQS